MFTEPIYVYNSDIRHYFLKLQKGVFRRSINICPHKNNKVENIFGIINKVVLFESGLIIKRHYSVDILKQRNHATYD